MRQQIIDRLQTLIRACTGLYVVTHDYTRAANGVQAAAKALNRRVVLWSSTRGFRQGVEDQSPKSVDTLQALDLIQGEKEDLVAILENFHTEMDEKQTPQTCQKLVDTIRMAKATHKCIVVISPSLHLPEMLEKLTYVYEMPLPERDELAALARDVARASKVKPPDAETATRLGGAACGLTMSESETAIALALAEHRELGESGIETVRVAKEASIRKTGLLEIVSTDVTFESIGGLELIKEHVETAREIIRRPDEAAARHCENPKGIVLLGPPGTGKSVASKAIARTIGCPMGRLDMGMVMNQPFVGVAENRIREVLRTAQAMAPIVIQIDEIDKALAGSEGSGMTDSGVTARVIQQLLTFMAENRTPVYFVGTCNSLDGLPDALTRKGRFDEVFYVDLPEEDERQAIWRIHLAKREIKVPDKSLDDLVAGSVLYSGAEIEQVVKDSVKEGFAKGTDVTPEILGAHLREITAWAKTNENKLDLLRKKAAAVARPARRKAQGPSIETLGARRVAGIP